MYLFNKAKNSIVKTLQYDKSSPLVKLNYLCRFILKNAFVLLFTILALLVSTIYFGQDLQNKQLLQIFAILISILCFLSYVLLMRSNGSYTLSKIKMYPFSFKDLIDISLTTGTLTISLFDIFLCYVFLLVAFLVFLTAGYSVYTSLENPYMKDTENINSFTLEFASVFYIGLYAISQYSIFRTMPYHPLEYLSYIAKNIGEDIATVTKKLFKFML